MLPSHGLQLVDRNGINCVGRVITYLCSGGGMTFFEPETWVAFSPQDHLDYIKGIERSRKDRKSRAGLKRRGGSPRNGLIIQTRVSPLDLYTYLKARFGEPNGMQTRVAADDSDNLYHWDYMLKAGGKTISFVGATQEVHVWLQDDLTDAEWLQFINNLKRDFGRVGRDKSAILHDLEKWSVFPNRYLTMARICEEHYDILQEKLPLLRKNFETTGFKAYRPSNPKHANERSKLLEAVSNAALQLPVLIPVLFESFIGLLIALLVKPQVKANARLFEAFKRSSLDIKLFELVDKCQGFARPISHDNEVMKRFWSVVNRRNDIIHGNIDPIKDATGTVYFDGKRPLYPAGGDRIDEFFRGLMESYNPEGVLADYALTHEFIIEILDHMAPQFRESMIMLMGTSEPGWDDRRQKSGVLFPEHMVTMYMPNIRHDSDLREV